ncbi:MAG: sulfotransferase family 2 domain-containing protein [Pararhodobacter sp.]
MSVIIDEFKLSYIPVPKIACTSLKTMFFEIENGFPFRAFKASGRRYWIHELYRSVPFDTLRHEAMADHTRIAVLRDPVKRLLSCYSNRVIHHKELSEKKAGAQLARAGLPADPDLDTFIMLLDDYCAAVDTIGHHALPMVDYLGRDPGWYTQLYRIEDTKRLAADMQKITGREVGLQRLQKGGPKIAVETLSAGSLARVQRFYAEDYDVYGAFI